MLGWVIGVLFVLAGAVTGLFVSKDALNFSFIQTVVVVIIFTLIVTIICFWSTIVSLLKRDKQDND